MSPLEASSSDRMCGCAPSLLRSVELVSGVGNQQKAGELCIRGGSEVMLHRRGILGTGKGAANRWVVIYGASALYPVFVELKKSAGQRRLFMAELCL